jgi:proprotein convertase subtilisin/kexin type 5
MCAECEEPCSRCLKSDECIDCIAGYYYYKGSCMTKCPDMYYESANTCQPCESPCLTCKGTGVS